MTSNKVHDDGTIGGVWNQLDSYERASGIDFTHGQLPHDFEKNAKISKTVIWPKDVKYSVVKKTKKGDIFEEIAIHDEIKLPMNAKKINEIYGSKIPDEKCVFWMKPFRNMKWHEMLTPVSSWKNVIEHNLAKNMVKSTSRPKSVKIVAQEFMNKFLKNRRKNYISVHWRYEKHDFGAHCKKKIQKGNEKPCQYILSKQGFNISKIERGFKAITERQNLTDASIFFAAPPGALEFIRKLKERLEVIGLNVVFQDDLRDFVEKKFCKCEKSVFKGQIHDFLSQVEQEICLNSWIFIPSTGSSWSNAIELERRVWGIGKIDIPNNLFF